MFYASSDSKRYGLNLAVVKVADLMLSSKAAAWILVSCTLKQTNGGAATHRANSERRF